ncbi:MAG: hypothetical protein E6912_06875 [Paeniclostridium sordellii]|nr:hypothetical protein [Paeniclostridium sordellii]
MKNLKNIIIGVCILSSIVVTGCSSNSKESSKENAEKTEKQYEERDPVKLTNKEKEAVKKLKKVVEDFATGKLTRKEALEKFKVEGEKVKNEPNFKIYFDTLQLEVEELEFKDFIRKMLNIINSINGENKSIDDLKITEEKKEVSNNNSNKKDDYRCPICGGDCPKDSECTKYMPGTCTACGKPGVVNKDLVSWTNNHGEHLTTHKGSCTEIMKEEDEAHTVKTFHCEQCGRAVQSTPAAWTGICQYCLADTTPEENNVNGSCPKCGGYLSPYGKCADCGYGYE